MFASRRGGLRGKVAAGVGMPCTWMLAGISQLPAFVKSYRMYTLKATVNPVDFWKNPEDKESQKIIIRREKALWNAHNRSGTAGKASATWVTNSNAATRREMENTSRVSGV